jgi:hypothetical protein
MVRSALDLLDGIGLANPIEFAFQPGATIDLPSAAVTLFAFGADETVNLASDEPSSGAVFLFGAHSTIVCGQQGGEHLFMVGDGDSLLSHPGVFSSGQDTIVAAGNNELVSLPVFSEVSDSILLSGLNDRLSGNPFPGSTDSITVTGANAAITVGGAAGGANTILLQGTGANVDILPNIEGDRSFPFGNAVITATGSGTATITGGGATFSFTGGTGQYSVSGGVAEHATISGGNGGGTFTGGDMKEGYVAIDTTYIGNNIVQAGTQASTVVGAAHGQSLLEAAGSATDSLIAGEYGQDTMSAGAATGNELYLAYSGPYAPTDDKATPSLVVNAGAGNDTLVSGLAADTLSGGAGNNVFEFFDQSFAGGPAGAGNTLITDFTQGHDKLDLAGFAAGPAQILSTATVAGGATTLHLSNGQNIMLAHISALSANDFTTQS